MSGVPIANFLVDFGNKDLSLELAPATLSPVLPIVEEVNWAERLEEARARGFEEGRQAAELEVEKRLSEQKAEAEQDIAAARATWCAEAGPQLADQFSTAVREMEDRVTDALERVLRPFLVSAVRKHAISELRATLEELVGKNPGIALEISGPEDLLEAVRESLPASLKDVGYAANDAREIQVKAGTALIETRIANWLDSIAGQIR